jgi:trimeric autotransporter adhesin
MTYRMIQTGLLTAVSALALTLAIAEAPAANAQEAPTLGADAELAAKGTWSAATTYAIDDIVTSRGSTWRSKRNNNLNKIPGQTQPSTATSWELFARGFNPLGAWSNATLYQPDDLVTFNGQTFRAKLTKAGSQPAANQFWQLLAQKGDPGPNTGIGAGSQAAPSVSFSGDPDTGIFHPAAGKIALVEDGVLFLHNNGTDNTALGLGALTSNIGGNANTAIGASALQSNTNGARNSAFGHAALAANTSGSGNTAVGRSALSANTTGTSNTAVGTAALTDNTAGQANIAVGSLALTHNTTGQVNTALGTLTLGNNTTGSDNTAVGGLALLSNTTGVSNAAVGSNALSANTTASFNTAIGSNALAVNTIGTSNTAVGSNALAANTLANGNTALGRLALAAATTGGSNTAVGSSALAANTTGFSNIAVGVAALDANTTGIGNIAVGVGALGNNTSGNTNAALGIDALQANTNGENNTALGRQSLFTNSTGDNNIAVGYAAGGNPTNPDNSIFIGNLGLAADTTTIKIGTQDTQTTTFVAGIRGVTTTANDAVAVLIDSNGQLGTGNSSRRYKDDIETMADVSALLARLRPVTFRYKAPYANGGKPIQYGLIAEEVADVFPDLAVFKDGVPETVKYHLLPSFLLAGYQAQQRTIAAQTDKIEGQAGEIADLKQRLIAIETMLPKVTKAAAR